MREGEYFHDSEDDAPNLVDQKHSLGGVHHEYKKAERKPNNYYQMEEDLEKNYEMRKSLKNQNYQHER
jgi:ubiquitin